jgi:prepilin-type N-terminal cleavage/methylation domain-containing protein
MIMILPQTRPRPSPARGFTLAEMSIGLIVLGMAGLASAALLSATGQAWENTDQRTRLRMTSGGASNAIYNLLRGAKLLGVAYSDSTLGKGTKVVSVTGAVSASDSVSVPAGNGAACMFWRDTADPTKILLKDLALLEHDIASNQLRLWQVPSTAANAGVQMHPTDFDDPSDVAAFKALPNVAYQVVAINVLNCRFNTYNVNSSSLPAMIEFYLVLDDPQTQRQDYGCVAPRALVASTSGL